MELGDDAISAIADSLPNPDEAPEEIRVLAGAIPDGPLRRTFAAAATLQRLYEPRPDRPQPWLSRVWRPRGVTFEFIPVAERIADERTGAPREAKELNNFGNYPRGNRFTFGGSRARRAENDGNEFE